jgi:hypothetical protein
MRMVIVFVAGANHPDVGPGGVKQSHYRVLRR